MKIQNMANSNVQYTFYENGDIETMTTYISHTGVMHGLYNHYKKNGKLWIEGHYVFGKKHGKFYIHNNAETFIAEYLHDKILKHPFLNQKQIDKWNKNL